MTRVLNFEEPHDDDEVADTGGRWNGTHRACICGWWCWFKGEHAAMIRLPIAVGDTTTNRRSRMQQGAAVERSSNALPTAEIVAPHRNYHRGLFRHRVFLLYALCMTHHRNTNGNDGPWRFSVGRPLGQQKVVFATCTAFGGAENLRVLNIACSCRVSQVKKQDRV
jgi:hypothetical protein